MIELVMSLIDPWMPRTFADWLTAGMAMSLSVQFCASLVAFILMVTH